MIGGLVITFALVMSAKIPLAGNEPQAICIETPPERTMPPKARAYNYGGHKLSDSSASYQQAARVNADANIMFALKAACRQNVSIINTQVELWYIEKETFPKGDLSDIGRDRDYFPNGIPPCPVDGSSYSLDPVTHRIAGHNHEDIPNIQGLDEIVIQNSDKVKTKKTNPSPNSKQNRP